MLFGSIFGTSTFERSAAANNNHSLALVGAKIYPSPTAAPIVNGIVLVKGGRILAVGETSRIRIPTDATRIDCTGLFMTAAFWNSHVHFTEAKWQSAITQPASQLADNLRLCVPQDKTGVFDFCPGFGYDFCSCPHQVR